MGAALKFSVGADPQGQIQRYVIASHRAFALDVCVGLRTIVLAHDQAGNTVIGCEHGLAGGFVASEDRLHIAFERGFGGDGLRDAHTPGCPCTESAAAVGRRFGVT